ncbi:MAG: hypothetical protein DRN55_07825 [Thermoplasmata archaeon]|nr:MAG: hypothetical protein DRN55_07825 [Thermoplasmata archaeon]
MHNRSYPSPRGAGGEERLRTGGSPKRTEMMWERGGVVFSSPGVGGERSICEPGDPGGVGLRRWAL